MCVPCEPHQRPNFTLRTPVLRALATASNNCVSTLFLFISRRFARHILIMERVIMKNAIREACVARVHLSKSYRGTVLRKGDIIL